MGIVRNLRQKAYERAYERRLAQEELNRAYRRLIEELELDPKIFREPAYGVADQRKINAEGVSLPPQFPRRATILASSSLTRKYREAKEYLATIRRDYTKDLGEIKRAKDVVTPEGENEIAKLTDRATEIYERRRQRGLLEVDYHRKYLQRLAFHEMFHHMRRLATGKEFDVKYEEDPLVRRAEEALSSLSDVYFSGFKPEEAIRESRITLDWERDRLERWHLRRQLENIVKKRKSPDSADARCRTQESDRLEGETYIGLSLGYRAATGLALYDQSERRAILRGLLMEKDPKRIIKILEDLAKRGIRKYKEEQRKEEVKHALLIIFALTGPLSILLMGIGGAKISGNLSLIKTGGISYISIILITTILFLLNKISKKISTKKST